MITHNSRFETARKLVEGGMKITVACKQVGIERTTYFRRMKKLGGQK